ncbi:MAG: hypothetical protein ABIJ43_01935 [Candidatus Beckwithbacteria bacterium]|nr:hypothetical protein [Patescibacteria group bacterium]
MPTITNTNAIILLEAAKKLGIKTQILQSKPFKINFTHQNKSHIIRSKSFNLNTSSQALEISKNKSLTNQTLALANLPTPRHTTASSPLNYQDCNIPFPQVIKPSTGEKGKHVYLNIKDQSAGQTAVNHVLSHYPEVQIETYHQGDDYRFLCLNFKLIGLAKRLPPTITGDGKSTIRQLIEIENLRRFTLNQKAGRRMLNRMRNWPRLAFNLHLQGLSLQAVLPQEKTIELYKIPNFSTGGSVTTIDISTIHPSLINLAEKVAKTIGLQICGIDMLVKQARLRTLPAQAGLRCSKVRNLDQIKVIEVNSDPGLRLHDWPNKGTPQNVSQKILKSIFQP